MSPVSKCCCTFSNKAVQLLFWMDHTHLLEVVCGGTVSFQKAIGFQNLIHRTSTGVSWLRSKLLWKWSLAALFSAVSNDLRGQCLRCCLALLPAWLGIQLLPLECRIYALATSYFQGFSFWKGEDNFGANRCIIGVSVRTSHHSGVCYAWQLFLRHVISNEI